MKEKRIAWAITGAGHALEECVDTLLGCRRADLFLSRAGEEVLRMYGLTPRIRETDIRVYRDDTASVPVAGRFYAGAYGIFVVAPATSNSVAKFVHGISDNLVTTLFAQAGKSRTPVLVYPSDLEPEMDSCGPDGEPVKVFPRPVDLENTRRLEGIAGTKIVRSREELAQCLAAFL
jgi:dihydromethanopterin reductase (acceptor)